jgi:hypothetical protein
MLEVFEVSFSTENLTKNDCTSAAVFLRFWRQIQGYHRQALKYDQRPSVYVCA